MDRALDLRHKELLGPDNDNRDPSESRQEIIAEVAPADLGAARPAPAGATPPQGSFAAGDEAPYVEHLPNAGPFHDIPASIWAIFLAGWAGFFLLMFLFFAVDRESDFMVTVAILFGAMAFGVPIAMAKQARIVMAKHGRTTPERAGDVIHTHTGAVSVRAAAAQIALIPVAVFFGFLCFIIFAK